MTTWTLILIVISLNGGMGATNVTGFTTLENCEIARQAVIEKTRASKDEAICVEVK